MAISKAQAIKDHMGTTKPVTFAELKELMNDDKEGFFWMANECAAQLGETILAK